MANVEIQYACSTKYSSIPSEEDIEFWVSTALPESKQEAEICVRIVERDESQNLNNQYRSKDKPTNVLSFPSEIPPEIDIPLLGDLVVCAAIVEQEAVEQSKSVESHWAHLVIHGTLHLIGYDHIEDSDADAMETLETKLMLGLGYPPPYLT